MSVRKSEVCVPGAEDPDATRSSLVNRLRDWDDQTGWQDFFDRYWKLIYAVAVKAGLSDAAAQDVVQETVVAVAKQMREGGYNRTKSSFKNWLCLITRRRIVDHFRRRTKLKKEPFRAADDTSRTSTMARVPDPASLELDVVWDEEWCKNLADAAIERVKEKVSSKQFQIFDLAVLKDIPVREVTKLLKVNAAQVYLARHRVWAVVDAFQLDSGYHAVAQSVAANPVGGGVVVGQAGSSDGGIHWVVRQSATGAAGTWQLHDDFRLRAPASTAPASHRLINGVASGTVMANRPGEYSKGLAITTTADTLYAGGSVAAGKGHAIVRKLELPRATEQAANAH